MQTLSRVKFELNQVYFCSSHFSLMLKKECNCPSGNTVWHLCNCCYKQMFWGCICMFCTTECMMELFVRGWREEQFPDKPTNEHIIKTSHSMLQTLSDSCISTIFPTLALCSSFMSDRLKSRWDRSFYSFCVISDLRWTTIEGVQNCVNDSLR